MRLESGWRKTLKAHPSWCAKIAGVMKTKKAKADGQIHRKVFQLGTE